MQADGKAWLFAPAGLVDGPLPAHYEPQESPFPNLFYGQQHNPVRQIIRHPENRYQPSGDQPGSEVFPYVTTTYRLTEHHTAGGMSRFLPYLSELQPALFCEVSPQLAAERGLEHLGWATIVTARSAIEARVHGDRADPAPSGPGSDAAPGRSALALGRRTGSPPGMPPTSWPTWPWIRTCTSKRSRPWRATSGPGGGRAGPQLRQLVRRLPETGRHHRRDRDGGVRWTRTSAGDIGPRPGRAGRLCGPPAAGGLLHRHFGVHRLQGLRSGLQGVERRARGRARC